MTTASRFFAHLHLHSAYSLIDSTLTLPQMAAAGTERGIAAIALTDQGNMHGFIHFYRKMREAGIKPICGLEVLFEQSAGGFAPLVLLARNMQGYRNLMDLSSRTYLHPDFDGTPRLLRSWLQESSALTDGLCALSCAHNGEVGQALLKNPQAGLKALDQFRKLFHDEFYLEVCRTGSEQEHVYLERAVDCSIKAGCPLVASNDVRFLNQADFPVHEARYMAATGQILADTKSSSPYLQHQHLASADDMAQLFADMPEAIDNALELARRCTLELEEGKLYMPASHLPAGEKEADWIEKKAVAGLKDRLQVEALPALYSERLQYELSVIEKMGFTGYFLVVADFVNWAQQNQVTVGPGRGSGAGALVSWALGICDLDPMRYGLLFERFLNPERVSPPDIDIDFDPKGRGKVIDYVISTYGRQAVAQIATLDFLQAKAAIRDSTRVLGFSPGLAHKICSLFPNDRQLGIDEAEEQLTELQQMAKEDAVRSILDLAKQLEGLPRNASRHAGGVVIAPGDLTRYAPLFQSSSDNWVATQYDKKDLEYIGLVKFDFLGLTTLAIIDDALEEANRIRPLTSGPQPELVRNDMDLDDEAAYDLICNGQTEALFQLESPRMRSLIQRFAPEKFTDLIALLALIRPGPLEANMFDVAVACKVDGKEMQPPHPLLAEVVEETWGVMLYQEQVMEAARRLADYSYGEADELRRAMGAKDRDEMGRHRSIFVERAAGKNIASKDAEHVFELMAKFAGYGFNKSHSAAYAILSLQTAWLKAHYPACFMAATMTQEVTAPERERRWNLIRASRSLGLKVLQPDVNHSEYGCRAEIIDGVCNAYRLGLGAINGVGEAPAERIAAARRAEGPFENLYDFCLRADMHLFDRRVLDMLNSAGALASLEPDRASAEASLDAARTYAALRHKEQEQGQNTLFIEQADDSQVDTFVPEPVSVRAWSHSKLCQRERAALGMYLQTHPLQSWRKEMGVRYPEHLIDLDNSSRPVTLLARLHAVNQIRRMDYRLMIAVLDDETHNIEVEVENDVLMHQHQPIAKDELLLVTVAPKESGKGRSRTRYRLIKAYPLAQVRRMSVRRLVVELELQKELPNGALAQMEERTNPEGCLLVFRYKGAGMAGDIQMPEQYRQPVNDETLEFFRSLFGGDSSWFEYNG
ncbi:MAG: DNA polymerase III subunit alpha [Gammaproteobacteria bacterium]